MRKIVLFLSVFFLSVSFLLENPVAREPENERFIRYREWSKEEFSESLDEAGWIEAAPAAVDTFDIVCYDFESMDWQGWTRYDWTAQHDTFWHVDDFDGLGGGDYGRLVPIEGTKSLWCGARPGTDCFLGSWVHAPGYGNAWNQWFVTEKFSFEGLVTISFHGVFDSEPDYDYTYVEYSGNLLYPWTEIASFDGTADTVVSLTYNHPGYMTKIRFRFVSDGAWSDQDGLWNTDGAAIIDSITISDDSGVRFFEDFESADVGAKEAGIWYADVIEPFGLYSSLWFALQDSDPCNYNMGSQIVFFCNNYSVPSFEYPGLFVTPFCKTVYTENDLEICQHESVISPLIDMTMYSTGRDEVQDAEIPPGDLGDLGGTLLKFTVYRDLPYANVVYYDWDVREVMDGCPGEWRDRGFGYGGAWDDYIFSVNRVDDLVDADTIQVMLSIMDMCDVWFDVYGDCAEHTTSPYFDNVKVQRFKTNGPQWSCRMLDFFQDNFPSTDDMESFVRADVANDVMYYDEYPIIPGDSLVVTCDSPLGGGIAVDGTGPRIYMHVRCRYIGGDPVKPDLAGPALEGTWGNYLSDDGTWTIIQADTAFSSAGNPAPDKFAFDLNDSLFTRGYMIEYYFSAYDVAGERTTLPWNAETAGDYPYPYGSHLFEFTCLPTLNTPFLYVDDYDGRGSHEGVAEVYWNPTFEAVIPGADYAPPDRYDVLQPYSGVSNGPGSRAHQTHLRAGYEKILWDSGDLDRCTISEGTEYTDKSADCQMLTEWLEYSPHKTGLLVMGDNIAEDLSNDDAGPAAQALMETYCGVDLVSGSYYQLTGGIDGAGVMVPQLTGLGPLAGISYYAFGACPMVNSFDVFRTTGPGQYALQLPQFDGTDYYAGIYSDQVNSYGHPMRTLWIGHSMMFMRNGDGGNLVRNEMLRNFWEFTEGDTNEDITAGDTPAVTDLSRSYPNPFNPYTTIEYSMAVRGHVSIKIYDVTGRLVRTIVDGTVEAGAHVAAWDGTGESGAEAASGVYFCRMKAAGFEENRKMVLLR